MGVSYFTGLKAGTGSRWPPMEEKKIKCLIEPQWVLENGDCAEITISRLSGVLTDPHLQAVYLRK